MPDTDDPCRDAWMEAGAHCGLAAYKTVQALELAAWTIVAPLDWALTELDARYARRQLDRLCRHAAVISDTARQSQRR